MADYGNLNVIVGLLAEIKGMIKNQDSLIPVYSALALSILGSIPWSVSTLKRLASA